MFTGLSGSGKCSLAFDTIYAEGQRRYVESLSAYARQFLGQMDKPDVDIIEGLSPAISIDQKSASRNPRSTVGTITEVYDYLRLLYARIGMQHCPNDGTRLQRQTPQQIVDRILLLPDGTRFQVLAPVVRGRKGEYEHAARGPRRSGLRPRPDRRRGRRHRRVPEARRTLARYEQHTIEVIIDRLVRRDGIERRLTDSLETALKLADGVAEVEIVAGRRQRDRDRSRSASTSPARRAARSYEELAPRNFSFNSPYGACEACDGLGTTFEVDPELLIPDPEQSINDGAIAPWRTANTQYFTRMLEAVAEVYEHRPRRAVAHAHRQAAEGRAARRRGQPHGQVQEPLRPSARVLDRVRGRHPVAQAPPRRAPRATGAASSTRATCARCRARRAAARG